MRVQPNPNNRQNGRPLVVRHPTTGQPFPDKPFTLTAVQLADPDILRLLPKSAAGGLFGDLVPVEDAAPAPAPGDAPKKIK